MEPGLPCPDSLILFPHRFPIKLLENFGLDKDPLLLLNLAFLVLWKHFSQPAAVLVFLWAPLVLTSSAHSGPAPSSSGGSTLGPTCLLSHVWGMSCHGEDPLGLERLLESDGGGLSPAQRLECREPVCGLCPWGSAHEWQEEFQTLSRDWLMFRVRTRFRPYSAACATHPGPSSRAVLPASR